MEDQKRTFGDIIGDTMIWVAELPVIGAVLCTVIGVIGTLAGKDMMGPE